MELKNGNDRGLGILVPASKSGECCLLHQNFEELIDNEFQFTISEWFLCYSVKNCETDKR